MLSKSASAAHCGPHKQHGPLLAQPRHKVLKSCTLTDSLGQPQKPECLGTVLNSWSWTAVLEGHSTFFSREEDLARLRSAFPKAQLHTLRTILFAVFHPTFLPSFLKTFITSVFTRSVRTAVIYSSCFHIVEWCLFIFIILFL